MSKTLTKPTFVNKSNSDIALKFAEAGTVFESTGRKQAATEKRAFFAPEGYRRLTINLRDDLHKKLRLQAVEQDCTATDIIVRLLNKEFGEKS
jgi:hypothetical protein